ncbi:spg21 [Symbiodinium necroappetens]|uniref:Spg21 protein n=1 Tax=Symbiodinium necroappetens TaxID=1628268 RepID=A0A812LT97_9DINO|nr:spg21 [Symbiodinium necroappetens]
MVPEELRRQLKLLYKGASFAELKSRGDFPYLSRPDEVTLFVEVHMRRFGAFAQGPSVAQVDDVATDKGADILRDPGHQCLGCHICTACNMACRRLRTGHQHPIETESKVTKREFKAAGGSSFRNRFRHVWRSRVNVRLLHYIPIYARCSGRWPEVVTSFQFWQRSRTVTPEGRCLVSCDISAVSVQVHRSGETR